MLVLRRYNGTEGNKISDGFYCMWFHDLKAKSNVVLGILQAES